MSLAQRIAVDTDLEVSDEARQRINSARTYDISFLVKKRLGDGYTTDDVDMLVEMIRDALENNHTLAKDYILTYLKSRGRSGHRAEQLASALLK
jgi:hypothetical protein